MKYELWYSVVVRDRQGKVVSRERRRSRSFLKQWNQLVYIQMAQTALNITDTGGTPRSISPHNYNFWIKGAAGETDYGIRVGTGDTAVAIDDYALETPIEEGTGADQMEHLFSTVSQPTVAAPSCSFLVSRAIVNNSGAEITVREAGIYMWLKNIATYFGCATHDVFVTPQAVPDGGTITVDWTIQVTV
ncbi:hypothetical protein ES705_25845 [subsurface metagenome]